MLATGQGAHRTIGQTLSDMEEGLESDPRAPHTQPGLLTSCKLPRKHPVLQKFSFLKSTSRGLGDGSVGKLPATYEDLSSDPQYPCKEPGTVAHAYNARVGQKEKQGRFLKLHWSASLAEPIRFSETLA